MCEHPCNSCGNCHCTCTNELGCLDIYPTSCINYNGISLSCIGVNPDTNLNDLLVATNAKLCDLIQSKGKVKTDESDDTPKSLIDKLQAGANIILTGTGTGPNKKIRIDAVLGGAAIDEKVKVSPTDTATSFLENKIVVGECLIVQKQNPGFDEKLKISIDWGCVLSKLSALPQFCELVNNCVGDVTTICPSISLNSPAITGDDVTLSWVSTATNFNVYLDGILMPGMPTGSNNYTFENLSDGAHTVQVSAVCSNGSSNSATTNFTINTTCPSASSLNANISSGNASLTWGASGGVNVVDQTVQYRLRGAASWTTHATVSSSTTSASITGLLPNEVYEFRIMTNCSIGGPTSSPITAQAQLTCPAVTLTPSATTIQYSFINVGGDVNQYIIELLNNTGTSVLQTKSETAPFASNITNTFTGLTQGTNYQVRVKTIASEFSFLCNPQAISTSVPPACPEPTGLSGTTN